MISSKLPRSWAKVLCDPAPPQNSLTAPTPSPEPAFDDASPIAPSTAIETSPPTNTGIARRIRSSRQASFEFSSVTNGFSRQLYPEWSSTKTSHHFPAVQPAPVTLAVSLQVQCSMNRRLPLAVLILQTQKVRSNLHIVVFIYQVLIRCPRRYCKKG